MQTLKYNERSKFYSNLNITESVCVKVNYTRLAVDLQSHYGSPNTLSGPQSLRWKMFGEKYQNILQVFRKTRLSILGSVFLTNEAERDLRET